MGGLLTPLMAQQMSGRTGRRGLDTQGNIVYLGMNWDSISKLIRGKVPEIQGQTAMYPTIALQHLLSDFIDERAARNSCSPSLRDHTDARTGGVAVAGNDYLGMSKRLLDELGLVNDDKSLGEGMCFTALTTCWELRSTMAESLLIAECLPLLKDEFVIDKPIDYGERIDVQADFFVRLLHIIERRPPYLGISGLSEISLSDSSFVLKNLHRSGWEKWEALLLQSQGRLDALSEDLKSDLERTGAMTQLKLAIKPGQPIDATLFKCILDNRVPMEYPSAIKHDLKQRLFNVGTTILKIYNCVIQPGLYQGLEILLRKCFRRLFFMLNDVVRNESSQKEVYGPALSPARAAELVAAEAEAEKYSIEEISAICYGDGAATEDGANVACHGDGAATEDGSNVACHGDGAATEDGANEVCHEDRVATEDGSNVACHGDGAATEDGSNVACHGDGAATEDGATVVCHGDGAATEDGAKQSTDAECEGLAPMSTTVPTPQSQAVYVADVTVPDSSFFLPGTAFFKVKPVLHCRSCLASPCGASAMLF
jgi:hypothetical protein